MKKIYRTKKNAKNEFTRLSGVKTFELIGGSECLITEHDTRYGKSIQKYAYELYTGYRSPSIIVKNICGVKNCVKKEHLTETLKLPDEDKKYILDWYKVNGIEYMENAFKIPAELIKKTLNL